MAAKTRTMATPTVRKGDFIGVPPPDKEIEATKEKEKQYLPGMSPLIGYLAQ